MMITVSDTCNMDAKPFDFERFRMKFDFNKRKRKIL